MNCRWPFSVNCLKTHSLTVHAKVHLTVSTAGIHAVAYAYPKVKIVTTAVDKCVNEKYHIIPGIGTLASSNTWMTPQLE